MIAATTAAVRFVMLAAFAAIVIRLRHRRRGQNKAQRRGQQ
jgi:hypothetical protein